MFNLEIKIGYFFQNLIPLKIWGGFWLTISNFFVISALLLLVYFYISIDRRIGFMFIVTTAISMLINTSTKLFVGEQRPFIANSEIKNLDVRMNNGFSFPSSHCCLVASTSTVFFTYYKAILSFYTIYYVLINISIGLSRVILGSHYIHDCFMGYLLGAAFSFFLLSIFYRYNNMIIDKYRNIIGSCLIVAGLICSILAQCGINFFVEKIKIFYIISGLGGFILGDGLERKFIGCNCSCKFLKRIIRFALFLLVGFLIYLAYSLFFILNIIFTEILILIMIFYSTIGFSWLGTILMLYEKNMYN